MIYQLSETSKTPWWEIVLGHEELHAALDSHNTEHAENRQGKGTDTLGIFNTAQEKKTVLFYRVSELGESGLLWVHNPAAQSTHQPVVYTPEVQRGASLACRSHLYYEPDGSWVNYQKGDTRLAAIKGIDDTNRVKTAEQTWKWNILIGNDVWQWDKRPAVTWQLTIKVLYTSSMATLKWSSNTHSCRYEAFIGNHLGLDTAHHLMVVISRVCEVTIVKMNGPF